VTAVVNVLPRAHLPRGWHVVDSELRGLVAVGPGPTIGGISPRVALSLAPKVDDAQAMVRAQIAGLFADDVTLRAIDEEGFVTVAGDRAHRVLTSRIVNGVGLTTDHWVVTRDDDTVVLAGAAPSAVWPVVQPQVRRALRAMLAAI
jgi:hypothetical protein